MWITASRIIVAKNFIADHESQKSCKDGEWMLNASVYEKSRAFQKVQAELDCIT